MKLITVIVLLIVAPLVNYGQEYEQEEKPFHFIEAGIGASHVLYTHGAFSAAFTNSLRKYMASFIDYNQAFGKSNVLFHEVNTKIGPFFQFNRYSYVAASSGLSFMWNTPFSQFDYNNFTSRYSEGKYLISIPIQVKLNIGVYKGCCIGWKGTLNKMIEKKVKDKATAVMYLAWGW